MVLKTCQESKAIKKASCLPPHWIFWDRILDWNIYPSIHPFVLFHHLLCESWSPALLSWGEAAFTPWTSHQFITCSTQRVKQPSRLSTEDNLELPVRSVCMSLDCGRNRRELEGIQADTGRTCRLNSESPRVGLDRSTLPLLCQSSYLNLPKELTMNDQDMFPFQLTYQSPFSTCCASASIHSASINLLRKVLPPQAYCNRRPTAGWHPSRCL